MMEGRSMKVMIKMVLATLLAAVSQAALAGWLPSPEYCRQYPDFEFCGIYHPTGGNEQVAAPVAADSSLSLSAFLTQNR
jgi:hypothetical protein